MAPAVEPHVTEADRSLYAAQKRQRAADVVGVDMRHHEQLEAAIVRRQRFDAAREVRRRLLGAAVDQPAPTLSRFSVLDPDGIAVTGGQHLHIEERPAARPAAAARRGFSRRRRGLERIGAPVRLRRGRRTDGRGVRRR